MDSVKLLSANNAYNIAKTGQALPGMPGSGVGSIGGQIAPSETAFSNLVSESIGNAVTTVKSGETTAIKGLLSEANLADLATAVTDAELALKTVVSVRDRIISAYQDIIKMPI